MLNSTHSFFLLSVLPFFISTDKIARTKFLTDIAKTDIFEKLTDIQKLINSEKLINIYIDNIYKSDQTDKIELIIFDQLI